MEYMRQGISLPRVDGGQLFSVFMGSGRRDTLRKEYIGFSWSQGDETTFIDLITRKSVSVGAAAGSRSPGGRSQQWEMPAPAMHGGMLSEQ